MKTIVGVSVTAVLAFLLLWAFTGNQNIPPSVSSANWQITQVQSRITARDSSGVTFGWKVTIKNDLSEAGNFVGQVHFLDKDGFEIRNDYFNLGDNFLIAPHSEHTFVGSTFFYNQQNPEGVAKVTATARRD
jgi:hypothetical protein